MWASSPTRRSAHILRPKAVSKLSNPVFSVIVPCYNEQESLQMTHERLTSVLAGMGEGYEIVYVNDGSRDKTPAILNELAKGDAHARVIHFARNFGHQIAVSAGLDYAAGDALVIIDADLQDPPEVIPEMAEKWRAGAQVVYGKRRRRDGESALKKLTAHWYYKLLSALSRGMIPEDTGDFRLVDRQVADVIRGMPEHARFLRGMFAWAGFEQEAVLYDRDKRFAGKTHYTLGKMLRLAADGIISLTDIPLRVATRLGMLFCLLAGLCALVLVILALCGVPGGLWWLAALNTGLAGCVLVCVGGLGAYVGRVYEDARGRPLYIVRDTKGFAKSLKP